MRDIRNAEDLTAIRAAGIGFVHNRDGQILHLATCAHLAVMSPRRKRFFATRDEADRYLSADPRRLWDTCPDCLGLRAEQTPGVAPVPLAPEGLARAEVRDLPLGFEVRAPAYVPFNPKTAELRDLREEVRSRLRALRAGPGQLLHARFAGSLPRGADIENALLYNIDQGGAAMVAATAEGLRFEVDPSAPPTGVAYRYELAASSGALACWRVGRSLAVLDACSFGPRAPRCTQLWWALKAARVDTAPEPLASGEDFAVFLTVKGPSRALRPEAVKALVDAVVCSLQAHDDRASAAEPAARIAAALGESAADVLEALCRTDRAALGIRERLVQPWGASVQWLPEDNRCVAGDFHFSEGSAWCLRGDVRVVVRGDSTEPVASGSK